MQTNKQRVLCIDNHASSNLTAYLLERASYEVRMVSSTADGIRLARSEYFDLYLLNHKLVDGSETRNKLHEFAPHTPILFYSTVTYPYRQRVAASCHRYGHRGAPVSVCDVVEYASRLIGNQTNSSDRARSQSARVRRKGFSTIARVLAGVAIGAAVILIRAIVQCRNRTPFPKYLRVSTQAVATGICAKQLSQ